MRMVLIAAAVLIAVSSAWADQPPRTIMTSGEATVYVVPDKVTITLGVEEFDKDLDQAVNRNDQASASLLKAIKDLGVDDKDVQVAYMNVSTVYDNNYPNRGLAGYKSLRSYSIRMDDTKLFEKVVQTALKSGANEVESFQFDTTQMRACRDKARLMAIRAAKEKAVLLANALDCQVGPPMSIQDQSDNMWGTYSVSGNVNGLADNEGLGFGGGGMSPQVMPVGEMAVKASVNVTFFQFDAPAPAKQP
jgi:uncharacterized protein YggE